MTNASDRQANASEADFLRLATDALHDAHSPARAYVRSRVGDPDDADDVLQAALVIAWEKLPELRDSHRIRQWFLRICRSVVSHRPACARATLNDATLEMVPDLEPVAQDEAMDELLTFDRRIRSIVQLPPQQRAVVITRLYLGLSVAETARVLRKRPGTVKATLNQAMKRLRESDEGTCHEA
jgi:RNA polymerase sigma-70 factor, ECF subfamily